MAMATFDDMVRFVKTAYLAKDQIVACLEGPAGIGKTAAVNQAAKELADKGMATGRVVTIIASQILPNEVSGITMPVIDNKSMEIFDHYRLASLQDGDILFFDELLEADQLVLSACLTLIESRQMMSGRKLPDIQIVAATNATIKPNMLKESIRQRFVWRKFDIIRNDCAKYIMRTYGLNVNSIVYKIEETSNEYNILTPRSLTKMAHWISQAEDDEEAETIAYQINRVWQNGLGNSLLKAWKDARLDPREQLRRALVTSVDEAFIGVHPPTEILSKLDVDNFNDTSITELMEMLKSLDEWRAIEQRLNEIELVEASVDSEVNF